MDGSTQDIDDAPAADTDEPEDTETAAESSVNPQTPSINEESTKSKAEKPALKKPDKILPCPRCNSMDTKFCYYNNYNVNQPRHFCKACQRYWTAGGTIRNVPVGAGRRKSKSSASHYRHITISEALQAARIDAPNRTTEPKSNSRVLSFGLDPPICDQKVLNGTRNGEQNGDDCSSASSAVSSSMEVGSRQTTNAPNGFGSPNPCLPGVPWHPYRWNPALPVSIPAAFCPPGYSLFYPAAAYWSVPFPSPQPANRNAAASSGPISPTLGKRSRDADNIDTQEEAPPKNKNGCVLVPKTLRIDDPSEAAKSSIWSTLGIKRESVSNGAVIKAFQPKSCDKRSNLAERSPVLRANPAALSRSINFHERS